MKNAVLVIDDKEKLCKSLCRNLEESSFRTHFALDTAGALRVLESNRIDIVLLDIRLGDEDGTVLLQTIHAKHPSLPVIMITAFGTVETAVKCLKSGAVDYVQKPIDFPSLLDILERTLDHSSRRSTSGNLCEQSTIITRSRKMFEILEKARRLALTDLPVLILGESGTGKELLADFIHRHSPNSNQRIIGINCSAFPEPLLENELFGHEKGSFTNAINTFQGVFEQAKDGTLFLDEIGDMALSTQAKILRTIQNGEIRRIGGKENIRVKVRILAATNKDPGKLIENGGFRSDLLYRLNTATITLPPLRERKEDIGMICEHVLRNDVQGKGRDILGFSEEVMDLFLAHDWPGNIRELRNTILYAAAVAGSDIIVASDLPVSFTSRQESEYPPDCIQEYERRIIQRTLAKTGYNKKQAAEILNISRKTLYNKLERYGIEY